MLDAMPTMPTMPSHSGEQRQLVQFRAVSNTHRDWAIKEGDYLQLRLWADSRCAGILGHAQIMAFSRGVTSLNALS